MNRKMFSLVLTLVLGLALSFAGFSALKPVHGEMARPSVAELPIIADFEGSLPTGWFQYAGGGATEPDKAVITVGDTDALALPGQVGDNDVLSITVSAATGWSGFGAPLEPAADWSTYDAVSFWYYGENLSTPHEFEIQTANNGNHRAAFVDDFMGWQKIILPFSSFGDGGDDDVSQVTNWVFSLDGTVGSFKLDHIELVNLTPFADFEDGLPATWFQYAGGGATEPDKAVITVGDTDGLALPGQVGDNDVLSITVNAASGWSGFGAAFDPVVDWSDMQGVGFWFYGENLATTHEFEIQTASGDDRRASFVDDFTGWRFIALPFTTFGDGSAYDVSQVDNWVFVLDGTVGSFKMDHMSVYGDAAPSETVADFTAAEYTFGEDVGEAVITVRLNMPASEAMTVSYSTEEDTALAGDDYTTVSGLLSFAPGQSELTFTIPINDDAIYEGAESLALVLSDPETQGSFTLIIGGVNNPARLTIMDDDMPPDAQIVDDFETEIFMGRNDFNTEIGFVRWGNDEGDMPVLTTTQIMTAVPGMTVSNTVLSIAYDINSWGGLTHILEDDGEWVSQDWSAYDGLRFWLYGNNTGTQIQVEIFDNLSLLSTGDAAERWFYRITDDYTGWKQFHLPFTLFQRRTDWQPGGAPNDGLNLTEVSGYAFGLPAGTGAQMAYLDQVEIYGEREVSDMPLRVNFSTYAYAVEEGQTANIRVMLNTTSTTEVSVDYMLTADTASADKDYVPVSGTLTFAPGIMVQTIAVETVNDPLIESEEELLLTISDPANAGLGWKTMAPLFIHDNDHPDASIIEDFEGTVVLDTTNGVTATVVQALSGTHALQSVQAVVPVPGQWAENRLLNVTYALPSMAGGFTQTLLASRDGSAYDGMGLWFYGMNTGTTMTLTLLDNRVPDPGPSGWELVWSDEFEGAAGTAPDPSKWGYDIGGAGWGNRELEYYTDERENSALDGTGGLVITATESTTTTYQCNHTLPDYEPGTCGYTSARLLTQGKFDFAYGRAEARIKIPFGQGIWPAFWSLGADFGEVGWPNSGEIDILENIGTETNDEHRTVHGTVHGPGYFGENGIGGGHTLTEALSNDYHIYAIEWESDEIRWYIDDTQYFTLTPTMLPDGTEWVFDHPFFLIMNVAVGGYWPGDPDETTQFPQTMQVDYVRVYQFPESTERFETTFNDDFTGWKQLTFSYDDFTRSAVQPSNAPDDGLTLTSLWGYGLNMPANSNGSFYVDDVRFAAMPTYTVYLPLVTRE